MKRFISFLFIYSSGLSAPLKNLMTDVSAPTISIKVNQVANK
jgi:hypothetical protein